MGHFTEIAAVALSQFQRSNWKLWAGIILSMGSANEKRRYIVASSFIGWAHTQNDIWWVTSTSTQRMLEKASQ